MKPSDFLIVLCGYLLAGIESRIIYFIMSRGYSPGDVNYKQGSDKEYKNFSLQYI